MRKRPGEKEEIQKLKKDANHWAGRLDGRKGEVGEKGGERRGEGRGKEGGREGEGGGKGGGRRGEGRGKGREGGESRTEG